MDANEWKRLRTQVGVLGRPQRPYAGSLAGHYSQNVMGGLCYFVPSRLPSDLQKVCSPQELRFLKVDVHSMDGQKVLMGRMFGA